MFEHLTDPKEIRRQQLISLSDTENALLKYIRSPRFRFCSEKKKQDIMLSYFKVMDEINKMYVS